MRSGEANSNIGLVCDKIARVVMGSTALEEKEEVGEGKRRLHRRRNRADSDSIKALVHLMETINWDGVGVVLL